MSSSPISSSQSSMYQIWQALLASNSGISASGSSCAGRSSSSMSSSDSATISPLAQALLAAAQGATEGSSSQPSAASGSGSSPLTDTIAAQVGSIIDQTDPTLFQQLNTSGSGTLSANELQTGIDNLLQQAQPSSAPAAAANTSSSTPSIADDLTAIQQALQQVTGSGQGHGHHHHHHAQPASSSTASSSSASASDASTTEITDETLVESTADSTSTPVSSGSSPYTDAQAAQAGALINQSDPTLFQQLNTSGSGTLTADELQTGLGTLLQQVEASAFGSGDTAVSGTTTDATASPESSLSTILQALQTTF